MILGLSLSVPATHGRGALAAQETHVVPQHVPALTDTLRADLERLLEADEPALRGEAAVALALTREPAYYRQVLRAAGDSDPAARLPALLALGYLGAPGAEAFLGRLLLDNARPEAERQVAALALGLLPADQAVPAIHEYLVRIAGGSYEKHRDVLCALLLGLGSKPHPERAAAVRQILLDASNKEPALHQLGVRALALVPGSVTEEQVAKLLQSSVAATRLATLQSFVALRQKPEAAEVAAVEKLVRRDPDPRVRAAALRLLTKWRRLSALEFSVQAVRSPHPEEAAAALQAAMYLGGGSIRAAAEERILATKDAELQVALLQVHSGPWSPEFLRSCLEIAGDRTRDVRARVAAAVVAAHGVDERVAPMLRDLFREARDADLLHAVCKAMQAHDGPDVAVSSLYPPASPEDAKLLPARTRALVTAEHPLAQALVHTILGDERMPAAGKAAIVRAFRVGAAPPSSRDALHLAPPTVRTLLQ